MTTFISKSLARKREMLENDEKGFTLIELLIVVLIIGVLAAIAIPIYLTTMDTARDNAVKSSVSEAKTAVVAAYTDSGTFPGSIEDLQGFAAEDPEITLNLVGTSIDDFCVEGYWGAVATDHPYFADQDGAARVGDCTP